MVIPYTEALSILRSTATQKANSFARDAELISITSAIGRICRDTYHSPTFTPTFDSSAMDGFAVNSSSTSTVSPTNPIILKVDGIIAAGDAPLVVSASSQHGHPSCIEIMTGAQFPTCSEPGYENFFDACVKVEDTSPVLGPDPGERYIQITKPACLNQNRRFAGTDFQEDDLIIDQGTTIKPHHVMALATLGIQEVTVYRKLRIGVLSTGKEIVSTDDGGECGVNQIRDSNGPFVEAVLTELGAEVVRIGAMKDDVKVFERLVSKATRDNKSDIVISTGAVSMGKFDFVREGLSSMKADILFHGVKIRPGHPVLFANLPTQQHNSVGSITPPSSLDTGQTAFFGLPGNPLATAVCLRFLVIPYLRALHGIKSGEHGTGSRVRHEADIPQVWRKPCHLQTFWHGKFTRDTNEVTISKDQSSNKIKPLLDTNCWVGVPAEKEMVEGGDLVDVYDMYPPSLGS